MSKEAKRISICWSESRWKKKYTINIQNLQKRISYHSKKVKEKRISVACLEVWAVHTFWWSGGFYWGTHHECYIPKISSPLANPSKSGFLPYQCGPLPKLSIFWPQNDSSRSSLKDISLSSKMRPTWWVLKSYWKVGPSCWAAGLNKLSVSSLYFSEMSPWHSGTFSLLQL